MSGGRVIERGCYPLLCRCRSQGRVPTGGLALHVKSEDNDACIVGSMPWLCTLKAFYPPCLVPCPSAPL